MNLESVKLIVPENCNIILGQAHFIKSVEDIYEAVVNTVPGVKFGIAFCEASGKCLVRFDGNDEELTKTASENAYRLSCGHSFIVVLKDAFPINLTGRIKDVPEVCNIFCATANPVEVIVASTEQGRGIMGVIDGAKPAGIEGEDDKKWRYDFLRTIGYKK
ncbi:MAG: adenosine-specific kinase [Candidatus Delongbacteria bacterium]|jgi:adenosine/AMP kinase|nr:adenosine-specific kinase [Candidatus Delongbacteria bacterium]MDY0017289.1 adenosine-specific kinase [Candidatus Delongbacteria bacterium]